MPILPPSFPALLKKTGPTYSQNQKYSNLANRVLSYRPVIETFVSLINVSTGNTSATLSLIVSSKPSYYTVVLTQINTGQVFVSTQTSSTFILYNLEINTQYSVLVTTTYPTGNKYVSPKPTIFRTLNYGPPNIYISNITGVSAYLTFTQAPNSQEVLYYIINQTDQYGNNLVMNYLLLTEYMDQINMINLFNEIIEFGTTTDFFLDTYDYAQISNGVYSYQIVSLHPNQTYQIFVTTVYSKGKYDSIHKFITTLNESPVFYPFVREIDGVNAQIQFQNAISVDLSNIPTYSGLANPAATSRENNVTYDIVSIDSGNSYAYFNNSLHSGIIYDFNIFSHYPKTNNTYKSITVNGQTSNQQPVNDLIVTYYDGISLKAQFTGTFFVPKYYVLKAINIDSPDISFNTTVFSVINNIYYGEITSITFDTSFNVVVESVYGENNIYYSNIVPITTYNEGPPYLYDISISNIFGTYINNVTVRNAPQYYVSQNVNQNVIATNANNPNDIFYLNNPTIDANFTIGKFTGLSPGIDYLINAKSYYSTNTYISRTLRVTTIYENAPQIKILNYTSKSATFVLQTAVGAVSDYIITQTDSTGLTITTILDLVAIDQVTGSYPQISQLSPPYNYIQQIYYDPKTNSFTIPYIAEGLSINSVYTFYITSYYNNTTGNSYNSPSESLITYTEGPPTDLSAISILGTSVKIGFTPPIGEDIAIYEGTIYLAGSSDKIYSISGDLNYLNFTNLTPNTGYYVIITSRYILSGREYPSSPNYLVSTINEGPPNNVDVSQITNSSLYVSYSPSVTPPSYYSIIVTNLNSLTIPPIIIELSNNIFNYNVNGLRSNTYYSIVVKTTYEDQLTYTSNIINIPTKGEPTNLFISNITDQTAIFNFTKSVVDPSYYMVLVSTQDLIQQTITIPYNIYSGTVTNLMNNTSYRLISVAVYDDASYNSLNYNFDTYGPPTNIIVSNIKNTSFTVNFTNAKGSPLQYIYLYDTVNDLSTNFEITTPSIISDLLPNNAYTFYISAIYNSDSYNSSVVSVNTYGSPTELIIPPNTITDKSAFITFTSPFVTPDHYEVTVTNLDLQSDVTYMFNDISYTIQDLSGNTKYNILLTTYYSLNAQYDISSNITTKGPVTFVGINKTITNVTNSSVIIHYKPSIVSPLYYIYTAYIPGTIEDTIDISISNLNTTENTFLFPNLKPNYTYTLFKITSVYETQSYDTRVNDGFTYMLSAPNPPDITEITNNSATLDNYNDGINETPTYYVIIVNNSITNTTTIYNTNDESYTITNLNQNTVYDISIGSFYYRPPYYDISDTYFLNTELKFITKGAPDNIQLLSNTDVSASIYFSGVISDPKPNTYTIYAKPQIGNTKIYENISGTVNTYTITDLSSNQNYSVTVESKYNSLDESNYNFLDISSEISMNFITYYYPIVTGLSNITNDGADIQFTPPNNKPLSYTIIAHNVTNPSYANVVFMDISNAVTNYQVYGLLSNCVYQIYVYSVYINDISYSSPITSTFKTKGPPTNFVLSHQNAYYLDISFTHPIIDASSYIFTIQQNQQVIQTIDLSINVNGFRFSNLNMDTSYSVIGTSVYSDYSYNSSTFLFQTSNQETPYGLSLYSVTGISAKIAFASLINNPTYNVFLYSGPTNLYNLYNITSPVDLSGLNPDTSYNIIISALYPDNSYNSSPFLFSTIVEGPALNVYGNRGFKHSRIYFTLSPGNPINYICNTTDSNNNIISSITIPGSSLNNWFDVSGLQLDTSYNSIITTNYANTSYLSNVTTYRTFRSTDISFNGPGISYETLNYLVYDLFNNSSMDLPAGNYFANLFLVGAGYDGADTTVSIVGGNGGNGGSYTFQTVNINSLSQSTIHVNTIGNNSGNPSRITLNTTSYYSSGNTGNSGGAGGYMNTVLTEYCKGQPGSPYSLFNLDNLSFYYSAGGGGGGLGWSGVLNQARGGAGGGDGAGTGGNGGNSSSNIAGGKGTPGTNAITSIINQNTYYCGAGGGGAGGSGSNYIISADPSNNVFGGIGGPGKVIIYL